MQVPHSALHGPPPAFVCAACLPESSSQTTPPLWERSCACMTSAAGRSGWRQALRSVSRAVRSRKIPISARLHPPLYPLQPANMAPTPPFASPASALIFPSNPTPAHLSVCPCNVQRSAMPFAALPHQSVCSAWQSGPADHLRNPSLYICFICYAPVPCAVQPGTFSGHILPCMSAD